MSTRIMTNDYTNLMRTSLTLSMFTMFALIFFTGCTSQPNNPLAKPTTISQPSSTPELFSSPTQAVDEDPEMAENEFADILSVKVTGNSNAYQFSVEVASPDTGCDQYADWWEVLSEEGQLLYRRVLLHSHVTEQPFVRSGGPVKIDANTVVYIRAHLNTVGYGGILLKGTVREGFKPTEVHSGFGADLERVPPLPEDCAF